MIKLDRYIRSTILLAMLVVLLVLAGLDFIFSLFEEISNTDDNYQIVDALVYTLLIFPRQIYELLPMTALIGALVGLGVIASNNELVVMQASGIKVSRIVWAVMKPTGLVMLFGLCLGEFIAPPLELKAEVEKSLASGEEMLLSRYGFWQRDNNEYMHFNAIEPSGILHGVTIYEFTVEQQLLSNTFAETAEYHENDGEPFWLLLNGNKVSFANDADSAASNHSVFAELAWDISLSPELLQILIVDSDKMSTSDLYRYALRFKSQGQDASQYLLSFWKKILQPFATGALVLVAISFVFGPLREATMGSRVFTAVCFGLTFIVFQRLLSTLSLVYAINPFLATVLPIVLVMIIGLLMLRRAV